MTVAEAEADAARLDRRRRGAGHPDRQRGPRRRPGLLSVPQDPRDLPRGPRQQDHARPLGRERVPAAAHPGHPRGRRPPSPVVAEPGRARPRRRRPAGPEGSRPGEARHEAMDRAGDRGRAVRLPGHGPGGRPAGRGRASSAASAAVLAEPWGPGLHWGLPWGIDRVDRVKTGPDPDPGRRAPAGSQAAPLSRSPDPGRRRLPDRRPQPRRRSRRSCSTGWSDPVGYLFGARSVEAALTLAAESALMRGAGRAGDRRRPDDRPGRGRRADAGRDSRARPIDQGLGVSIRAVRLGRVAPPDAGGAGVRRRRPGQERPPPGRHPAPRSIATGPEADARGRPSRSPTAPPPAFDRRVQAARGEADRFTKVLAEARKAPDATRRRLYLEPSPSCSRSSTARSSSSPARTSTSASSPMRRRPPKTRETRP